MLTANVKKTFSQACMRALASLLELLAMLVFCLPFAFLIGIFITSILQS